MEKSTLKKYMIGIATYFFLTNCVICDCYWADVDESHDPSADTEWCSVGYGITAVDLDAIDNGANSPIIGAVRCCSLPNADEIEEWNCDWKEIGYDWSHYAAEGRYPMCSQGTYMTAIDLDSVGDDGNSPIIGWVKCCQPIGIPVWSAAYWMPIGYEKSHSKSIWCKSGQFVVSLDLDAEGDNENSPIVGQCECSKK